MTLTATSTDTEMFEAVCRAFCYCPGAVAPVDLVRQSGRDPFDPKVIREIITAFDREHLCATATWRNDAPARLEEVAVALETLRLNQMLAVYLGVKLQSHVFGRYDFEGEVIAELWGTRYTFRGYGCADSESRQGGVQFWEGGRPGHPDDAIVAEIFTALEHGTVDGKSAADLARASFIDPFHPLIVDHCIAVASRWITSRRTDRLIDVLKSVEAELKAEVPGYALAKYVGIHEDGFYSHFHESVITGYSGTVDVDLFGNRWRVVGLSAAGSHSLPRAGRVEWRRIDH